MIEIKWNTLKHKDPRWKFMRCLYAIITPDGREILWIGKAWGQTVRQRWNWCSKKSFWIDLEEQRGLTHHIVLIGIVYLFEDQRLTKQLLLDIETLLINKEKPWGNIMCQKSRTSRPGMIVKCIGNWPGEKEYIDE